jgi:cellulose synthase/poly-beta-1,6-N-acetylglucosamine synthase-like glycosyltransferase
VLIIVSAVLLLVALLLLLPTLSDLLSTILPPAPRPTAAAPGDAPRVLILIPAHDEELLIDSCLRSLAELQYPRGRSDILVIADNCEDATAARARQHGVRYLERHDTTNRGKPWAVAWALEQIALADFDAVVVLDADSLVARDFLGALARRAPLADKIVQGYIDVSNPSDSAVTRMAHVWSAVRFQVINRVKVRAGLNAPLGDGVCIGTGVLARFGWTAFSLSETWEVYASMTAAGVPCVSAEDAHLFAQEARSLRQSGTQRKRWTAGRLSVLRKYGPAVLRSPHIGVRQKLDCVAELTSLGPAAHLGVAAFLAAGALLSPIPGRAVISAMLLGSILRPVLYTAIAIARDPDPLRAIAAFAYLPIYVLWRLGIQISSVLALRQAPWIRTARHSPAGDPTLTQPAANSTEHHSDP